MSPDTPATAADALEPVATEEAAEPQADSPEGDADVSEHASVSVRPVAFSPLGDGETPAGQAPASLDLLLDIEVPLVVELGHTQMTIEELLSLRPGAILELDKLASEPVDLLVRGHVVAHGEIIVVDDAFGVRISRIVDPGARVQGLDPSAG